ncbi:MAG: HDOD domain-containing protein [Syntrophales bacterium]|jgi:HD-like signal output (HDOD) protein|nr:HDOD domain-containing protein [Syntrophales bacterium]
MVNLRELIARVNGSDIASIRRIMDKTVEVALDPNANAVDLKNLIEKDPPLAAKILRRANSAYYGLSHNVSDIMEAIMFIGFESVKELIIRKTVVDLFRNGATGSGGYSRHALWVHSVAVASCGKMIARRELSKTGNDIYTVGLLHDIGLIVADQFLGNDFLRVIEMTEHHDDAATIWQAEEDVFSFCHDEIGGALLEEWHFPEDISLAVRQAERPSADQVACHEATALLHISHVACQQRKLGYIELLPQDLDVYERCLGKFDIDKRALDFIMDDVDKQIHQMVEHDWF